MVRVLEKHSPLAPFDLRGECSGSGAPAVGDGIPLPSGEERWVCGVCYRMCAVAEKEEERG